MNPVPTVDEVIACLAGWGATPDPDADASLALASAIQAACRDTGVEFGSEPGTRVYNGRGDVYLPIDACSDILSITSSGSPVPVETWDAAPSNTVTKNALVSRFGRWSYGLANISVTATFGAAMPPDLYQAVIHAAAGALLPSSGSGGASVMAGPISEYREGEIAVKYAGMGGSGGSAAGSAGGIAGEYERAVDRYRDYAI